jgi:imidazolonepropionase-like amidohydrolase
MVSMLGMTPQQALTAATAAAELLGVEAGILAEGRHADLLLLDADLGG